MFNAPPWLVAWLQGISVWDLILWVVGIAGLILFIRKKGWLWIIAFARAILATAEVIDNVRELPAFIERTDQRHAELALKVEGIYHETHKNDGSSIKDALGRVEEGVAGLHGRLDVVEASVTTLARADEEIRAEIEHPKEST